MKENYTLENLKFLSKLCTEFQNRPQVTPADFLKECEDQLQGIEPTQRSWLESFFIGFCRHDRLISFALDVKHFKRHGKLKGMRIAKLLLYALLFELNPDLNLFLNELLMSWSPEMANCIFFNYLTSDENISKIALYACKLYTPKYVEESVTRPLIKWQPFLRAMKENYEESFQDQTEEPKKQMIVSHAIELLAKPRKIKSKLVTLSPESAIPPDLSGDTKHKAVKPPRKMLTKNKIDKRLAAEYKINQKKAEDLFFEANVDEKNYTKPKSCKYYETIAKIQKEKELDLKPTHSTRKIQEFPEVVVKQNVTQLKRVQNTLNLIEEREIKCLDVNYASCRPALVCEERDLEEAKKREELAIEERNRKKLLAQVAFEQAILAKEQVKDLNKKKYLETMKEKEEWESLLAIIKQEEEKRIKKLTEKLSLIDLQLTMSKYSNAVAKQNTVKEMKQSWYDTQKKALEEREKEYQERINMVKQMRALETLRKETTLPKVIDLTESGGYGFLNEMSIAELKERLEEMKYQCTKELDEKINEIKEANRLEKVEIESDMNSVNERLAERKELRQIDKEKKKNSKLNTVPVSAENEKLRKLLEEKRQERMKLRGPNRVKQTT